MKNLVRSLLAVVALAVAAPALAATLYISEFSSYNPTGLPAAFTPEVTHQTVTIGGSSTQSAAFNANTQLIRVYVDANACVQIGSTTPTATSSSLPMSSGQTEYFLVRPGDKLAVISCTP